MARHKALVCLRGKAQSLSLLRRLVALERAKIVGLDAYALVGHEVGVDVIIGLFTVSVDMVTEPPVTKPKIDCTPSCSTYS